MTYDQLLIQAMQATSQVEADWILDEMVSSYTKRGGVNRIEGRRIQRSNIAYYAGYYGNATRERVERLFNCAHPVFGAIAVNGPITPEQAFKAGLKMGEDMKAGREPQYQAQPEPPKKPGSRMIRLKD